MERSGITRSESEIHSLLSKTSLLNPKRQSSLYIRLEKSACRGIEDHPEPTIRFIFQKVPCKIRKRIESVSKTDIV